MKSFNSHHLYIVVAPKYVSNVSSRRRRDRFIHTTWRLSSRLVLHLSQGGHDIDGAGLASGLLNGRVLRDVSMLFCFGIERTYIKSHEDIVKLREQCCQSLHTGV